MLNFPDGVNAPAIASADLHLTIDGAAVDGHARFDVLDPATGGVAGTAPEASLAQLDQAVAAARRAFPAWSACPPSERRAALFAFAAALRDRSEEIAHVLTLEQGKELSSARREATITAAWVERLCDIVIEDRVIREGPPNRLVLRHRPIGVVGAIAPWNVPVFLGYMKVAHALWAGCTVILKPSPYTPLATLLVGSIARGLFPPGIVNVLAGGNALGAAMTAHPGIDKISFTGSTATGKKVMASAAATMKRVTLELGGNDAAIVLADADLDLTARGLFMAAFSNAGQVCMAVKRIYAHAAIADALAARLAEMAATHPVGSGFEAGVAMGPIQNAMQFDRVLELLDDAQRTQGVRVLAGGTPLDRPGYFLPPTIVTGLREGSRLVDEEQFGPVVPLLSWHDEDEVIARANATRFGLSASVWTGDLAHGERLAQRLEAGTVWVNAHGMMDVDAPFGGVKESGYGRSFSEIGIQAYMEPQIISVAPQMRARLPEPQAGA